MGTLGDGTGLLGSGLFTGGTDFTTWGPGEFGALFVAGYVVMSVLHTTGTAARATTRKGKAMRKALRA